MYSQSGEEGVIVDYFKGRTGTFLSIGENDGVTFSNVRRLAELGWTGVMVEPSPTAFRKLKENYAGKTGFYFYNFALGTSNGKVKFWDSGSHIGNGDHGLLSTMNPSEKERWKGQEYTEIEVQCFRWKTFLNRLSIRNFDFISCDCEGSDYEVMRQIDLRGTSAVCVEFNGDQNLKQRFDALMIGFRLLYASPENLVYGR